MFEIKNKEKRKLSLSGASSKKQKESSLILRKAKFQAIFEFVLPLASKGTEGIKYNRISAFVSMLVLLIRRSREKFFKKNFRDDSFSFLASPKDSLHRHPEPKAKNPKNNIKDWLFHFAYAQPLKMTTLAILLSLNISESRAAWSDNCPSGTTAGTTCKTCGDNCAYTENSEHVVTIYGSGEIGYTWKKVNGKYGYYDANNNPNPFRNNGSITGVQFAKGSNFTSIGTAAFWGTSSLTSITIPDSVKSIGNLAFRDASSLTSITIPDSVTSIGDNAFDGASSLTSITIPDSVKSIGKYTFYGASSLTSITIPEGVTSIGYAAFDHASSLESITIPDSVTSIGGSAFRDATGLKSITIPDSVTSIGDAAFMGATGLTSITIPDSVTSIGGAAFRDATGLKSITIPDSVTSIGGAAFMGATGLTSITIPDSVTSIGDSAFRDATGLTSITIPDSVTSIEDWAFAGASSLESITIPDSVTSIGKYAFDAAKSLTSITIPDSVTSIGSYAFRDATGLTNITIPDSVKSIGEGAFEGATGLKSITISDNINTAEWDARVFYGLPADTRNIVCQGDLNTCYEKLAKYFTSETCPQNLIDAGKGNLCSCSDSRYCILPTRISQATNASQDSSNQDKETISGDFNPADCYNNGQVPYNNQCVNEYPFAKKRWTPAEANEWLHDGNDNFVVITFKK